MGFVGVLAVIMVGAAAPGSATSPRIEGVRSRAHLLATTSHGGLTEADLARTFGDMDPAMLDFARRFAPAADPLSHIGAGPADALSAGSPQFSEGALQTLSWDAARLINASVPFSTAPNLSARPFFIQGAPVDTLRAVDCLTQAIYYEAAYEPVEGQEAVAQVVLNRLRHPLYPKTVCGVVYQGSELSTGCQFTFTCDGSLARAPAEEPWRQARRVAERALAGHVSKAVGEATHYHADYVFPYWAPRLSKVAKLGTHIFYRWSGSLGLPDAFTGRYAGGEPVVSLAAAGIADVAAAPVVVEPETTERVTAAAPAAVEHDEPVTLARAETAALGAAPTLSVKLQVAAPPPMLRSACSSGTLMGC